MGDVQEEDCHFEIPDFYLQDEEVKRSIVEAAAYCRGYYFGSESDRLTRDESIKSIQFLLKTGLVNNLEDLVDFDYSDDGPFTMETNGRGMIVDLSLGGLRGEKYRLTSEITSFEYLGSLNVYGECRSIADELMECSSLKHLFFGYCTLREAFGLPSGLASIEFMGAKDMGTTVCMIDTLQQFRTLSGNATAYESLRSLRFSDCGLEEQHFETILFDVLPKLPNLSKLNLRNNKIQSLTAISARLQREERNISSRGSSLRFPDGLKELNLAHNAFLDFDAPIQKKRSQQPESQIESLLVLLDTLQSVSSIGSHSDIELKYFPQIRHRLDLNRAGRALIANGCCSKANRTAIPSSLWPRVLQKATQEMNARGYLYGRCSTNFDGIYYLLRHGPALCARKSNSQGTDLQPQKKRKRSDH